MTHLPTGAWVYFRIQVVPALAGTLPPGAKPGDPIPNPFFTISENSIPARNPRDLAGRSGADMLGAEGVIASYVVMVEIGPAPPSQLESAIIDELRRKLSCTILDNAVAIADIIRERLRSLPSPSPPGSPPGFDTGELAESIRIVRDADGLGAAIGSPLGYARFLEFGTRSMVARPFLFSTFESRKDRIRNDVEQRARKIFGLATGTFGPIDRMGFPVLTGDRMVDAISIWARWYDQERLNSPDGDCIPVASSPDFSDRFFQNARDAIRAFDKFLKGFVEGIGAPDPPGSGPPPPTGQVPVGEKRLPRRR